MSANCRFHCAACGRHFTSLVAFDRHREGSYDARVCADPAERPQRMREITGGRCRIGGGPQRTDVTVWGVVMSAKARERLARLSGDHRG